MDQLLLLQQSELLRCWVSTALLPRIVVLIPWDEIGVHYQEGVGAGYRVLNLILILLIIWLISDVEPVVPLQTL